MPGGSGNCCCITATCGSRREQTVVARLTRRRATVLNGSQIIGDTPLKPGDLVLFAKIGCRVVATEKVRRRRSAVPKPVLNGDDDDGRTRVRMALPKYMLRGVSGPTFGKTYAMVGTMIVGRNNDCDICIPTDEISRHHAKLQSRARRRHGRGPGLGEWHVRQQPARARSVLCSRPATNCAWTRCVSC